MHAKEESNQNGFVFLKKKIVFNLSPLLCMNIKDAIAYYLSYVLNECFIKFRQALHLHNVC